MSERKDGKTVRKGSKERNKKTIITRRDIRKNIKDEEGDDKRTKKRKWTEGIRRKDGKAKKEETTRVSFVFETKKDMDSQEKKSERKEMTESKES